MQIINELEEENISLRDSNDTLTAELDTVEAEKIALEQENDSLAAENVTLKEETDNWAEKYEVLMATLLFSQENLEPF